MLEISVILFIIVNRVVKKDSSGFANYSEIEIFIHWFGNVNASIKNKIACISIGKKETRANYHNSVVTICESVEKQTGLGSVSRKSRNFSGAFRVT